MRPITCLFLCGLLGAQEVGGVEAAGTVEVLQGNLGAEPWRLPPLAPPGCWDDLLQVPRATPRARPAHPLPEGWVEVWGWLPPERPREEAFQRYLLTLRTRLTRALAAPPPKLQTLELGDFMQSDPSQPQKLDLTRVKSMQERYNRLPPNGSRVR